MSEHYGARFFGEREAAVYHDHVAEMFDPAVVAPVVGGHFVIELGVPDLQRLPPGQDVFVYHVDARTMSFDTYNVVTQSLTSNHFVVDDGRVSSYPVEGRYVWPSELDLMARLAGMRLEERWGGWQREPFTSLSRSHVSIYAKP